MYTFNNDYIKRDQIIFGSYNPDEYLGGVRDFNGLTVNKAKKLIDLRFMNEDECQNDSPTIKEFMEFAKKHEGDFVLNGYVINATRSDYRTSVDAIEYTGKSRNITDELIKEFIEAFGNAEIFDANKDKLYAWFD